MIAYLELPVIISKKEDEYITGKLRVIPMSVIAYQETDIKEVTQIYLQSGDSLLIALPIADYEKIVLSYYQQVTQKPKIKTFN